MNIKLKFVCQNCGEEYTITQAAYSRRQKLGRPEFCTNCMRLQTTTDNWYNKSEDKRNEIMDKLNKGRDKYWKNKQKI